MKIMILVPDGVGIRNYLYSDFLTELIKRRVEIFLYHKVSNAAILEVENIHKVKLNRLEIADLNENFYLRLLRESAAYARLHYFKGILKNTTVLDFWGKKPKNITLKLFYFLCKKIGFLISKKYPLLRKFETKYEHKIKQTNAYNIAYNHLKSVQPDFIINLHQRAPITTPVILAAQELKIKNSTVIFSWDNIPKGRLICRPDTYFVWSDLMKEQLLLLYREISIENVFVVGSPQFEFHTNKKFQESKEVFFNRYNLNINKKTICFSGDDVLTSPNDQLYLEDLCISIQKFPKKDRPQIIFRRCPVDFSNRYDYVLNKYSNDIFVIKPDWRVEKKSQEANFSMIYPSYNDLSILINTCLHSDVVVNLGSTMAHDFAIFNKPCLYLKYDPKKDENISVNSIYAFEHFKSMSNLNAVGWINSTSDFFSLIKKALLEPHIVGPDKEMWLKRIVQHPLEKSSINLANLIIEKCTSAL